MKEKQITISVKEYIHLKQKELELELLEGGGVDDWEWYGDSLNPNDEKFDDIMYELKKDILKQIN